MSESISERLYGAKGLYRPDREQKHVPVTVASVSGTVTSAVDVSTQRLKIDRAGAGTYASR